MIDDRFALYVDDEQETAEPWHTMPHPKKRAFLTAYRDLATIRHAAEVSKVSRRSVYRWKDSDPAFAAAMDWAREDAIESLELVARERARRKSDLLLIFLLKSLRPDVYGDKHVPIGAGVGANGRIQLQVIQGDAPEGSHTIFE